MQMGIIISADAEFIIHLQLVNMPDFSPAMQAISLDAAIVLTGRSKRTWWRRIADGSVTKLPNDSRGRAMLPYTEIEALIPLSLAREDQTMLFKADAGEAQAQADMGQFFYLQEHYAIAHYWLNGAAIGGNADAMQWLGLLHLQGKGVERDETVGMMWLYRAAAQGHIIASAQLSALVDRALRKTNPGEPAVA